MSQSLKYHHVKRDDEVETAKPYLLYSLNLFHGDLIVAYWMTEIPLRHTNKVCCSSQHGNHKMKIIYIEIKKS